MENLHDSNQATKYLYESFMSDIDNEFHLKRIDNYFINLNCIIGQGQFGNVYIAMWFLDPKTNKELIIKQDVYESLRAK